MDPLELVRLRPLMARTEGRPEIVLALIDGPVVLDHPDLSGARIRQIPHSPGISCSRRESIACAHGTFVAGMLVARRGAPAPAICPGCTLILRPIFADDMHATGQVPSASPEELGKAIIDVVSAGAGVINLSAALAQPSGKGDHQLTEALDYAASRGVLVVVAAGNQGTVGSSVITRHSWVIPVVCCDVQGKPTAESNLGASIGRRGLKVPAARITSLGTDGQPQTLGGTSAAAPFVTGAIALLWSEFPVARAGELKIAITRRDRQLPNTILPPLLNVWAAYQLLAATHHGRDLS